MESFWGAEEYTEKFRSELYRVKMDLRITERGIETKRSLEFCAVVHSSYKEYKSPTL